MFRVSQFVGFRARGYRYPKVTDAAVTNASLTSPFSINLPNYKKGDLLLLHLYRGGSETQTITLPAGFTKIKDEGPVSGSTHRVVIAWKIADGTEGSSISCSSTTTSSSATRAIVACIPGGTTAECSTKVTLTGTSVDPPSLSPSWGLADTLFLAVCSGTTNSGFTGNPWTLVTSTGPSGMAALAAKAASADPGAFTGFASMVLAAYTLAVRMASKYVVPV